jgi:S-DNA-T family DNA segregation ATPase FtsK/SpoIIIE
MNIKKIASNTLQFIINRLIEIIGVCISLVGVLFLIALVSYSPSDPNFIFPENTEIQNILGFQGSYISDLFFQSIGAISYLISITLFVTGINIFNRKDLFLIIENIFFSIFYCIFGSLFFDFFYKNTFELYINGNGGFVGQYLGQTFLGNILNLQTSISYFFLLLLILAFFLISINFSPKGFWNFIKKLINFVNKDKSKPYTDRSEVISEYIPQEEIKNLIQEDLPFIKAEKLKEHEKTKFKLPSLDLLKIPTKQERENSNKEEASDPAFLEKILLDFGVSGNIKKVSHGPVVTLNEFEPAAGVKVSKIINLSDDIARNTSSESARIATIPGSNTVGIELPNSSRENVYLSEILDKADFKKREIKLPIALGKNISGTPIVGDLASMPHLLIAGTTGSGKSVCINTIILSLLYRHTPETM